jgi:hypothetical protein
MNKRIKQLVEQAGFLNKDEESIDYFADLLIRDVIDTINSANINTCAYTTYDAGVANCTRIELVKAISKEYSADYTPQTPHETIFPVKMGRQNGT